MKRWPVSGGEEKERMRASRRSGSFLYASRGKGGCLLACVGVEAGEQIPEDAFLVREKNLMLTGEVDVEVLEAEDSLEEERKIPLKLIRRGDLGGESWCDGYGKMVLGEPGLTRDRAGADMGLEGRLKGPLMKKPLVGLAEWHTPSPLRMPSLSTLAPESPSRKGIAKELRSGMLSRSVLFFFEFFFLTSFFLVSVAVLPII